MSNFIAIVIAACIFFLWMLFNWDKKRNKKIELERAIQYAKEVDRQHFLSGWKEILADSNTLLELQKFEMRIDSGNFLNLNEKEWISSLKFELEMKIRKVRDEEEISLIRKETGNQNCWPIRLYSRTSFDPGIYRIFCVSNGKSYVGESKSSGKRLSAHFESLVKNLHKNSTLQADYIKFGTGSFGVEILEEFSRDNQKQRHSREAYWIDQFNSVADGYNTKSRESWTRDNIVATLKKFDKLNKDEQKNLTQTARSYSIKSKKLEDFKKTRKTTWTADKIQEVALQCTSRNELRTKYNRAYDAARRLNCLDEVCKHMGPPKTKGSKKTG